MTSPSESGVLQSVAVVVVLVVVVVWEYTFYYCLLNKVIFYFLQAVYHQLALKWIIITLPTYTDWSLSPSK